MNANTKGGRLRKRRHAKAARMIYAQARSATCGPPSFCFKMSCRDFEGLLLMRRELRDLVELIAAPN